MLGEGPGHGGLPIRPDHRSQSRASEDSARSPQLIQGLEETGEGLGDAARVADLDTIDDEPDERERHAIR